MFEKRNPDGSVVKDNRMSSKTPPVENPPASSTGSPSAKTDPENALPAPEHKPAKPPIEITDFQSIELVPGTILSAEPVPKSKKLLKLTVDIGREKRTIVAGIQASYTPEELLGKKVLVLANLKPAKLMGVESQGMILAAQTEGGVSLITFDRPVQPGSEIR